MLDVEPAHLSVVAEALGEIVATAEKEGEWTRESAWFDVKDKAETALTTLPDLDD